jgi:hypothetical protein
MGKFPAPKRIGPHGMRRWSWSEVERHINGPALQADQDPDVERLIRNVAREQGKRAAHAKDDGLEEAIKEAEQTAVFEKEPWL